MTPQIKYTTPRAIKSGMTAFKICCARHMNIPMPFPATHFWAGVPVRAKALIGVQMSTEMHTINLKMDGLDFLFILLFIHGAE
jgi:hypothetical protein